MLHQEKIRSSAATECPGADRLAQSYAAIIGRNPAMAKHLKTPFPQMPEAALQQAAVLKAAAAEGNPVELRVTAQALDHISNPVHDGFVEASRQVLPRRAAPLLPDNFAYGGQKVKQHRSLCGLDGVRKNLGRAWPGGSLQSHGCLAFKAGHAADSEQGGHPVKQAPQA